MRSGSWWIGPPLTVRVGEARRRKAAAPVVRDEGASYTPTDRRRLGLGRRHLYIVDGRDRVFRGFARDGAGLPDLQQGCPVLATARPLTSGR